MFRTNLRLVLWCGLGLWAATACGADSWLNCQIMPKSDQLLLRVGREISGDVYQIEWPATVERIEGQWLWVADRGGYHVPVVSGWVSKDDVLKLGDAQTFYMEFLRNADAPWVHWLLGICLETGNESSVAQQEYLKSLGVARDDANAVSAAVAANPNLLDAAIRLEGVKAAAAKSATDAAAAADRLAALSETAKVRGIRRPHAFFQQAEALNKAYRLKLEEERQKIHGIDEQIARATTEKDGGTPEDQALFKKADDGYRTTASADAADSQAGPHIWKGCMGRAELYLSRVAFLNDEVWSLIGEAGSPKAFSAVAGTSSRNRLGTTTMPIDLERLDAFTKCRQDPKPGSDAKQGLAIAHAACFCLAAEIQSLHEAVKCFDQAVAQSTDLVEAYRDRGLAYLALARCEATLAAILAALEKVDPDFQTQITGLAPDGALLPQKLDRAVVDGREQFNAALNTLQAAKAKEGAVATEKQEIAKAAADLAKNYVAAAIKHGGPDAKEQKKGDAASQSASILQTVRGQLEQLQADAGKVATQLDLTDGKTKADLATAEAALDDSYTMLGRSAYLRSAEQSARTACGKGNFASADSLQILAEIYASQCNFDRAEFYQKLAVIFASEDQRPQLLQMFHEYAKMDELITAKAKAKTPSSSDGQGKGSKPSGGDSAGGDSSE